MNTAKPKAKGNQPPSAIFTELAKKNARSMQIKGKAPSAARSGLQFQRRTATAIAKIFVINIVPVTAMP